MNINTDSIKGALGDGAQSIKDVLNSQQVKDLLPYLLAGAGGAAAGGLMTSGRRERQGESRLGHLGRILRNAAVTGGLAAGGTALLNNGVKNTWGARDKANPITGGVGNEGPLSTGLRGMAFSPMTALASGATGLAATHGLSGPLGAGKDESSEALKALSGYLKVKEPALKRMGGAEIERLVSGRTFDGIPADQLRQEAGLASGTGARGFLSKLTSRKSPLSTFGHTTGRRIGRGALGIAAAGIPALAGAFLTDDPKSQS